MVCGSTDFALKSTRIADFCDILSGFADFENTVDRGLAENFAPDSGLHMPGSSDCRYQNEVRITLFGLPRYVGRIVAQTRDNTKLVKKIGIKRTYTVCR